MFQTMARRHVTVLATIVFITVCLYSFGRLSGNDRFYAVTSQSSGSKAKPVINAVGKQPALLTQSPPTGSTSPISGDDSWDEPPVASDAPKTKGAIDTSRHPIQRLLTDAERTLNETRARQSKTLKEAVQEYSRRYGIPPPPHFDKWFEFAKSNNVQLVDEFDTIHNMITPFWGLKPATIRGRAKETLGYDNGMIGVAIRDHAVLHAGGGAEWQRNATLGMLDPFLKYLPDMDLAFNIHDEPRVIVPHDDLTRLVKKAKSVAMPKSKANRKPANDFTRTSAELSNKMFFEDVKFSRFNSFGRQATWTHSRMSCPPESPARILEEDERADDISQYGVSELGFVFNSTAMADICYSPSLSSTYGFFDRPNMYKVVHDLFPIFSQSKISSYNDIVYPSPWYWYDKVEYKEAEDKAWEDKTDSLYWRGSTTGGFSRDGGWRRQHRQHFVQKINSRGQAKIMANEGSEKRPKWSATEVPRSDYSALTDVYFSHIGQCDDGDCKAQIAFFDVQNRTEQNEAWGYKYLLDIDGNGFSGRFLAFLQSMSLTFKFALFREWHNEWLKPWVHYVPLSLQGDDWLETVRYFNAPELGSQDAKKMAVESRDWAGKVARKVDMEAWFFRLLLE